MVNICVNIYFWLYGLYSNDLETFPVWKYGISKASFILKSSSGTVAISYDTVPRQVGLKNICVRE